MDQGRYAALFLSESREHIGACNQHLGLLERDPGAQEAVHALFRAMHTIKGMAAMMGYAHVTELAHRSENLLDLVRAGTVTADAALVRLLTEAVDELDRGIEEAATGHDQALDFVERIDRRYAQRLHLLDDGRHSQLSLRPEFTLPHVREEEYAKPEHRGPHDHETRP